MLALDPNARLGDPLLTSLRTAPDWCKEGVSQAPSLHQWLSWMHLDLFVNLCVFTIFAYISQLPLSKVFPPNRRKFRSQTSDNMERWKAEQGRGREKRKIRRKKSRRERVRRQKMQMREKVGKSRNTAFFQWFVAPEGRKVGSLKRRVRSQLARGEMKNCTPLWREAHFEVKMYKTHQLRTTFGS